MESTSRRSRSNGALTLANPRALRSDTLEAVGMRKLRSAPPTTMTVGEPEPTAALEAALRDIPCAVIAVIGRDASRAVEWLQRIGHDAAVFSPPRRTGGHQKPTSRSRRQSDVIVALEWIEHEQKPRQALRAIRDVLAADGRLILVVPNFTHATLRLAMLLGPTAPPSAATTDLFTPSAVERLLNETGFTVTAIERQVDSAERLREMAAGVPGPVIDLLVSDPNALTSRFVFVAQPESSPSIALLHRRVRELTDRHRSTARAADHLDDRVAELEVRVGHWAAETDALAAPGVPTAQALAAVEGRIHQISEQVSTLSSMLAATTASETERDEAFQRLRDQLDARTGQIEALIRQVEQSRYRRLIRRIQRIVSREVPSGSIVAVVSRGDEALRTFDARAGWHFPQTDTGVYAGHHPADSAAAVAEVERLRKRGARYLLIPRTAFWWFDHYRGFHDHLTRKHVCVFRDEQTCALFELRTAGRRR